MVEYLISYLWRWRLISHIFGRRHLWVNWCLSSADLALQPTRLLGVGNTYDGRSLLWVQNRCALFAWGGCFHWGSWPLRPKPHVLGDLQRLLRRLLKRCVTFMSIPSSQPGCLIAYTGLCANSIARGELVTYIQTWGLVSSNQACMHQAKLCYPSVLIQCLFACPWRSPNIWLVDHRWLSKRQGF